MSGFQEKNRVVRFYQTFDESFFSQVSNFIHGTAETYRHGIFECPAVTKTRSAYVNLSNYSFWVENGEWYVEDVLTKEKFPITFNSKGEGVFVIDHVYENIKDADSFSWRMVPQRRTITEDCLWVALYHHRPEDKTREVIAANARMKRRMSNTNAAALF